MGTHGLVRHPLRTFVLVAALLTPVALVAGCDTADTRTAAPRPTAATAAPSGNGIDKLSAQEILDRATKAAKAAHSVRVRGRVRESGELYTIDMSLAGKKATGHVSWEGQRIELTRIGSTVYIKGNKKFWKANGGGSAAVKQLFGKHLKVSLRDEAFADLGLLTRQSKVVSEILKPDGPVTKGARAQIDGKPAIALRDESGDALYVAAEGEPYPLRIDPAGVQRLDFTAYNADVEVKRPPSRLVVVV